MKGRSILTTDMSHVVLACHVSAYIV